MQKGKEQIFYLFKIRKFEHHKIYKKKTLLFKRIFEGIVSIIKIYWIIVNNFAIRIRINNFLKINLELDS